MNIQAQLPKFFVHFCDLCFNRFQNVGAIDNTGVWPDRSAFGIVIGVPYFSTSFRRRSVRMMMAHCRECRSFKPVNESDLKYVEFETYFYVNNLWPFAVF